MDLGKLCLFPSDRLEHRSALGVGGAMFRRMNDDFFIPVGDLDLLLAFRAGALFARKLVADVKAGVTTRTGNTDRQVGIA